MSVFDFNYDEFDEYRGDMEKTCPECGLDENTECVCDEDININVDIDDSYEE